jgi:xanthine dehydrogenase YagR molybdenum-binding subunit
MLPMSGISAVGEYDASLQQSGVAGCQFAEVEVDVETGRVKPIKIVAVQDAGVILNKLTTESQINGAVIQGIGMALYEDRHMCQITGRMTNPNLEEYKLPGPWEMPEFVSVAWENPDAKGVSGIGEPPVIPTAAAIRNAVLNACGAYVNHAPMTPQHVLEALAATRRGGAQA